MVHVHNHSTGEVEAGGSVVQGQPQLRAELEVNLDYLRPYLKKIINNRHIYGLKRWPCR